MDARGETVGESTLAALDGVKKVVKAHRHYGIIASGLPVSPAERSL